MNFSLVLSGHVHVRVEDPVEIFFSLFRPTGSATHSPEEPWMPLDGFFLPFRGFVSLHVFDLGLLVGCQLVIAVFDR